MPSSAPWRNIRVWNAGQSLSLFDARHGSKRSADLRHRGLRFFLRLALSNPRANWQSLTRNGALGCAALMPEYSFTLDLRQRVEISAA
jgi:hypothetical protein